MAKLIQPDFLRFVNDLTILISYKIKENTLTLSDN